MWIYFWARMGQITFSLYIMKKCHDRAKSAGPGACHRPVSFLFAQADFADLVRLMGRLALIFTKLKCTACANTRPYFIMQIPVM